jgi:hypothetical protein
MDDIKQTYSYERGADNRYQLTHRRNGEVVATVDANSPEQDLEMALKSWILSPDLRKTVEGWLKTQRKPKAAPKTTKPKGQGTRGGAVKVSRMESQTSD